jgi:hypothetical protein
LENEPSKKLAEIGSKLNEVPAFAGFFLGSHFNPEDEGSVFL